MRSDEKPVLIGQAPGNPDDSRNQSGPNGAMGGRAAINLTKYAGWDDPEEFVEQFERDNVIREYPGSADGKGDRFPMEQAERKGKERLEEYKNRTILVAGKKTMSALLPDWSGNYYERHTIVNDANVYGINFTENGAEMDGVIEAQTEIYCIPHPSGINRHWNSEDNVEKFEWFVDKILEGKKPVVSEKFRD